MLETLQNAHKNGTKIRLFGQLWTLKSYENTNNQHHFLLNKWSSEAEYNLVVTLEEPINA